MKRKIYIYHHNDHDGIVAAAVFYRHIIKTALATEEQIVFNMIDYDKELNFDHINFENDDYAIFLDYSFSSKINLDRFEDLLNRCKDKPTGRIIWIDHHVSSAYICETRFADYDIPGIRNIALCGAALTYLWCNAKLDNDYTNDESSIRHLSSGFHNSGAIPAFLKLIDDYDCWKHIYGVTNDFHYGLLISDPKDPYIDELLDRDVFYDIVNKGKIIQQYLDFENREYHVNMYGFEFTLPEEHGGLKCFCLNRKGNSIMFGDKIYDYDAVIPFYYINGVWKYSIFTDKDNIDCEKVAKSYGGGGHTKAAGWQTTDFIFKK